MGMLLGPPCESVKIARPLDSCLGTLMALDVTISKGNDAKATPRTIDIHLSDKRGGKFQRSVMLLTEFMPFAHGKVANI